MKKLTRKELGLWLIAIGLLGAMLAYVATESGAPSQGKELARDAGDVLSRTIDNIGDSTNSKEEQPKRKSGWQVVAQKTITLSGRESRGVDTGLVALPKDRITVICVNVCDTVTFEPRSPNGSSYIHVGPYDERNFFSGAKTQHIWGENIPWEWNRLYRFGTCPNSRAGAVLLVFGSVEDATCAQVVAFSKGANGMKTDNDLGQSYELVLYLHDAYEFWQIVGRVNGLTGHHTYAWPAPGTEHVDGYATNPEQRMRFIVTIERNQ